MSYKVLAVARDDAQRNAVAQSGGDRLADYPSGALLRVNQQQERALRQAGVEVTRLEEPQVQVAGASFPFARALKANAEAPLAIDPHRKNYYLVNLVGPPLGAWLKTIEALGGDIQGHLKGFTLLTGMTSAAAKSLAAQPWVEDVTLYRPAMKVSPALRKDARRELSLKTLKATAVETAQPEETVQVEVSLFPGESAAAVAAKIRGAGGMVLSEKGGPVIAALPAKELGAIADEIGVRAILPHRFPKFTNDQAAQIMDVPANRVFGELTLTGAGQIVAVCDSGLDTGNAAAIHADFAGRIAGLVSMPNILGVYTNDPAPYDDGAQDANSGHGTHVAGSVLANGAAAAGTASMVNPQGTAPGAQLYFQAIEQTANWMTAAQLIALGVTPPAWWPPPATGLYGIPSDLNDLFNQAYMAGARIHTNSWGADNRGVYNATARQVDQFMWNNRDMFILFSAGNEAVDDDSDGVMDLDAINTPSTAKNCLTVGASENDRPTGSTPAPGIDGNWSALTDGSGGMPYAALGAAGHVSDDVDGMAAFSSRGPTDDGRIKPDVTAPGTNILSTRSSVVGANPLWGDLAAADPLNGLYCWSGGTSMATPLTAGAAAIIRQHLVQHRGHHVDGSKPSGALIKAFLVNGAVSMSGGQFAGEIPAEPNNVNGFGRVNLIESLTPGVLGQTLFADEPDYAVSTMEDRVFQVQAVDLAQPLKITMVWTDAPGPENVGGLQNQLYLQVAPPGGGAVLDGDLTPYPNPANNVQQVVIAAPVAGIYEIRVRGVSITQQAPGAAGGPDPRQDFALAVSNGMGFSTQPVSIAQAIDTTGSMGYYGFMEPAKERARQLVDFMRINDKVSITEFSHRPAEPNDARTPYPLRLLGNVTPDWTDARTAVNGLFSDGTTPIGAGLQEAWNQLSGEPAMRPRAIVLISDGFNNRMPDPASVLPGIPADVPIFTIALGPAANEPALQAIANSRPNGQHFMVDADEDIFRLHEIYAELQGLAAGAPMVGLNSVELSGQQESDEEVPIEEGSEEASFTLSYDPADDPGGKQIELRVIDPDGKRRTLKTAAVLERRQSGFHLVRVAAPKAGIWRVKALNRGTERPVRCVTAVSTRGPIAFSADPPQVEEERLFVRAQLFLKGKPLKDADVVARVTAPTLSRDDVLAQYGDQVREIRLPKEVNEEGLSEEQMLNLKLAIFARQFIGKEGGLYQRKTYDIALGYAGGGIWTADAPIPAPGSVSIQILASGKLDGFAWSRRASMGVNAHQAKSPQRRQRFELKEPMVRRSSLWRYTIIGLTVLKADGSVATPEDGVEVEAMAAQGKAKALSGGLPFYRRGRYFIWRLSKKQIAEGKASLTVVVRHGGAAVVKETHTIKL